MIGVTITGADDGVDPQDLADLSREFPFVEWGILHSWKRAGSRVGVPRYPSSAWLLRLAQVAAYSEMSLSLHLCGIASRAAGSGGPFMPVQAGRCFRRVQLNGYTVLDAKSRWFVGLEIILQVRHSTALESAADEPLANGSLLYDPSGGRGPAPATAAGSSSCSTTTRRLGACAGAYATPWQIARTSYDLPERESRQRSRGHRLQPRTALQVREAGDQAMRLPVARPEGWANL